MKKSILALLLCMIMLLILPMAGLAEGAEKAPIDLTAILVASINILGFVIARYLIPWLKERTTSDQRTKMLAAVNTAVYAAEQLFGPKAGEKKLAQVKEWLQDQGFDIDSSSVITAIEAAVQELTLLQL